MPNGDVSHESPTSVITLVTQEAAQVLESAGDGPLGIKTDSADRLDFVRHPLRFCHFV